MFTLSDGTITDFAFHGTAFAGSYADLTPGDFAVHFDTSFFAYDFGGNWQIDRLGTGIASVAVPEPSTWTLLIAGFGLVGVWLRRGSRVNHLRTKAIWGTSKMFSG